MTGRALVNATLAFANPTERVPRQLWSLPWASDRYPEMMQKLAQDFPSDIVHAPVVLRESSPVEKGNSCAVGLYTDPWGCVFENIQAGVIGEIKNPIVPASDEDWSDLSRIHIPTEQLTFDVDTVNRFCQTDERFVLSGCCPRPFEQLQFIRGTENLFVDLMDPPPNLLAFLREMHGFYCDLMERWAKTDIDALMFMDDWGTQKNLLIPPAVWCEIFKPLYRDYIEIAHAHGKKIFMHSDGNTTAILPHLIELGLDAINTQIFCIGLENLREFRGKITFWGEMDRQHLLVHGSFEEIDAAVQSVYDTLWDNGGCIAQFEFGPGGNPENAYHTFAAWDAVRAKALA